MKRLSGALKVLFALLAVVEHGGLLLWGVVWPLRHLGQYPDDTSINLFLVEASVLFLAFSLGAAADMRGRALRLPLLVAMTLALPCGLGVTLGLMRVLFLDPVVCYLTLLPGVAAVLCPYGLAVRLAPSPPSSGTPPPQSRERGQ